MQLHDLSALALHVVTFNNLKDTRSFNGINTIDRMDLLLIGRYIQDRQKDIFTVYLVHYLLGHQLPYISKRLLSLERAGLLEQARARKHARDIKKYKLSRKGNQVVRLFFSELERLRRSGDSSTLYGWKVGGSS